jgi:hypothetical protein
MLSRSRPMAAASRIRRDAFTNSISIDSSADEPSAMSRLRSRSKSHSICEMTAIVPSQSLISDSGNVGSELDRSREINLKNIIAIWKIGIRRSPTQPSILHIERILAGWVHELAVPIRYGTEVTGFSQHDAGVDVTLSNGQLLRTQYLVGDRRGNRRGSATVPLITPAPARGLPNTK